MGAVLIGGAFFAEHDARATQRADAGAAAVVNAVVRTLQGEPDSDADGMPDWEETLRGSDPQVYTTIESASTTDTVEKWQTCLQLAEGWGWNEWPAQ